jgi:phosphoglucosamine mutase
MSREIIKDAIISGLLSSKVDVVDLGILPTPALAFLTREMGFATGIMVTASHNPPEFNGIKLFNKDSLGYSRTQELEIEKVFSEKKVRDKVDFTYPQGTLGREYGMEEKYFQFMLGKFSNENFNRRVRLVVDPGNGAASKFASELFSRMGFEVIPLNDKPNGLFPGRNPEPKEDTLSGTIEFLNQENADLAICFDGDADRVVFCDREGFLGFNEMTAFISRIVVQNTGKKKVAATVESGELLDLALKDVGAKVVRGKVGDVNVAYLAKEIDAALGVESVGVYIIPEMGYYPDGFLASLILLSQIKDSREIREFFQRMPKLFFEKIKISCPNEIKELSMAQIQEKAYLFGASEINTLDGLRLEFDDSWLLIRASGTEPAIRVIAESTSKSETERLLTQGRESVQTAVEEIG